MRLPGAFAPWCGGRGRAGPADEWRRLPGSTGAGVWDPRTGGNGRAARCPLEMIKQVRAAPACFTWLGMLGQTGGMLDETAGAVMDETSGAMLD